MLQPTFAPTMFPASTTAASISLPSVHVNRALTPNSGQSRMPRMSSRCRRDKSLWDAVKQNNAKTPSHNGKPKRELDYKSKSPHLAAMPSPKVKYILINHDP
eukprot:5021535-Ditylum_brightwellii.AAC.1